MLTVPGLCWLCRMPLMLSQWGVCSGCSRAMKVREKVCPLCGLPAARDDITCGRCLQKPPPWQRLIAVSRYAPPLSPLVQQFKFLPRPEIARALARQLLLAVLNARRSGNWQTPDMILSVPLHARRQWRRGFNQSDLLCRALAHWLQTPYHPAALRRVRATPVQHQLNARLRKQNLKNAFRLELPVAGLHIVVVDDVVTTGSTVAEITRLLLRSGAATVQVWCLCRTL
ncbi:DNA utilization protein GntX [Kosakonia sacchari]|uniref:DNA utilization protein GntX n=1 Tax=Kosakonia sacchari TaxID=1158459 RepID=UPI000807425F|nr:DNA utilization protein GntX [Kosakonia sacchari]ANR79158.1 DNA utilization protein GntX [Kosakonia sacchari]NUL39034.1 DNA utilization protein GntX [Kosakonia sacchari]